MADDDLTEARREFQRCQDEEKENRETALEDIKFALLEEQWPEPIRKQREIDGRPMLTINKLPAFIRQVVNDARQNKPSVEVHPVDSKADPKTADVIAGVIRNIESISNADVAYDTAAEQAVASGFGYWRINVDQAYDDSFDFDVLIKRIPNQFSVYGDPNSTEADSSDWDVAFITDRISKDKFKAKYGDKANTSWDSEAWSSLRGGDWINDDGVLIAEWWRRIDVEKEVAKLSDGRTFPVADLEANIDLQNAITAGLISVVGTRKIKSKKVTQTIISGADVLEEEKEFPCRFIPIVPVYGQEIIVEGKRYFRSLIHSAMDAQRMVNYWRSTATELVALAPRVPFIGEEGSFSVDDGWNTANTASHAYLEFAKGTMAPQRQPLDTGVAAGALQEAMNASDDIKAIIGMYDASLGARSNETSGRAIMARQREGDVSTFHFVDNLTRAIRHTGKILIDMIPRVYTGERILRVLGEDGKAKNVPINQPSPETDEKGSPVQQPVQDENGNEIMQAVIAMHDLALGKYDITVKSGPSFTSRREEAAMQMTEMVRAFPDAAPLIADLLARNFDWPQADEVAERFEQMRAKQENGGIPPEVQKQIEQGKDMLGKLQQENQALKSDQQMAQSQMQVDQMKIQVDAEKVKVEQLKAQAALFEAQTERMKVEAELAQQQRLLQAGMMPMQPQPTFQQ